MSTDDTGTFKGDSPGKKLARVRHWISAANWMGTMGVPFEGALVLAGHGGDISTLMGLGFDPKKITAVDRARELAEYTGELYPESNVIYGDVATAARTDPRPNDFTYNATHLDFCNGLTVENIETIAHTVMGASTLPCWIGVTMMKGREQAGDKSPLVPKMGRRERRELQKLCRKYYPEDTVMPELYSGGSFDIVRYMAMAEQRLRMVNRWACEKLQAKYPGARMTGRKFPFLRTGKLSCMGQNMVRADVLRQCVNAVLWRAGEGRSAVRVRPVVVFGYHSGEGRKQGGGTSFITIGMVAYSQQHSAYLNEVIDGPDSTLMTSENMRLDLGLRGLKHFAIDMSRGFSSEEIALTLDIKKGVIAAWKAHDTMGTYDDEIAEMTKNNIGCQFLGDMVQCQLGWGKLASSLSMDDITEEEIIRMQAENFARRASGGPRWEE